MDLTILNSFYSDSKKIPLTLRMMRMARDKAPALTFGRHSGSRKGKQRAHFAHHAIAEP